MGFREPQTPGIGGLQELTAAELLFVQGLSALADPNADRLLFWDDSAGAYAFLAAGSGLSISGTTITATAGALDGSGTINEIAYWVDSDTLGALAVATYPSLTELSYVKGVTSAIQTQLNAKAATSHTHVKTDLTDIADFLLESEVDVDIKTLSLPASTTISAFGATLVDDAAASNARTTLELVAGGAGDIWVEKAGDAMTGALTITIADTANAVGLTITQNDTTNNPTAASIVNAGTGVTLALENNNAGATGPILEFYHNSASPLADDTLGLINFYGKEDSATKTLFSQIHVRAADVGGVDEDADFIISVLYDAVIRELWNFDPFADTVTMGTDAVTGFDVLLATGATGFVGIGSSAAAGILQSRGNFDLTLRTGNATTSSITITDGANGNITLAPNGSGVVDITSAALNLSTGENITVNNANPVRTIILSAAGGAPTTTIGCGGPTKVEAGTNDVDYYVLEFDTTTEERAFWVVQMPDNYDAGTITARFIWTNAGGASTETVTWGIKARGYADSDAIDQAYGTEVTVADTWLAQGDIHISAATAAITIGGSPAGGRPVVFNVGRKTASDNMAGDARLIAVQIEYGISTYSD